MNEQEKWAFFLDVFDASLPRLGPGDDDCTREALRTVLAAMTPREGVAGAAGLRILDLGCGNGAQTLVLAKHAEGTILAVDNHQPYLDELARRAEAEGVSGKVQARLGDMNNLGLGAGSFDLVWSEGALFVMGFGNGLAACHRLLKPGGCLAASELCWFRPDVPEECRRYFASMYSPMVDIDANLAMIADCGFKLLDHFTLPESAWLVPFYHPLEERLHVMQEQYAEDAEKLEMLAFFQKEIDVYRKFSDYYGYIFCVMQR